MGSDKTIHSIFNLEKKSFIFKIIIWIISMEIELNCNVLIVQLNNTIKKCETKVNRNTRKNSQNSNISRVHKETKPQCKTHLL